MNNAETLTKAIEDATIKFAAFAELGRKAAAAQKAATQAEADFNDARRRVREIIDELISGPE